MSVCRTVSEIFSVKEWRELETVGSGRSRSLKMAPFDRSYRPTTFYWSAIVNNHDLEKVTEDHSNWYHSKAWVRFPIRLP